MTSSTSLSSLPFGDEDDGLSIPPLPTRKGVPSPDGSSTPRSGASQSSGRPASVRVPEDTRVYAVGDIHGQLDLLRDLHSQIMANAATAPEQRRVLVYMGDYIDRGEASCQVVDLLLSDPLPTFERVFLRGNHEQFVMSFLEEGESALGRAWLTYGGFETLMSYGASRADLAAIVKDLESARQLTRDLIPPAHLDFFNATRFSHSEGDYFFVHAGIRPGVALDQQKPEDMIWIRDRFLRSESDHGKVVVHGHTICHDPVVRPNRIGIDTGAFHTGRLTCLVLTETEQTFLQTKGWSDL